ncbi:Glycerophosphoryl diester phosphodiesterase [uncultured Candidatus Thioglobus sp.]|nr:Glycerophosphoryl diester phosphodiesterase [uncultured Candidatus Thioglobus sp.]
MLKIIGHRFFSEHNLENTKTGLEFSIQNKAWAVETDVQLTKDKIPIIMHDKTLNRTTNLDGYVSDFTYQELQTNCVLNNGDYILSLEKCLDILNGKGVKLYLELIVQKDYKIILEAIEKYKSSIDIVISSFHHSLLKQIKKNYKNQTTMALFECNPINPIAFFKETYADEVGLGFESIDKKLVNQFASNNIKTFAWTVNNKQEIKRANTLALTGIFTDILNHKDLV